MFFVRPCILPRFHFAFFRTFASEKTAFVRAFFSLILPGRNVANGAYEAASSLPYIQNKINVLVPSHVIGKAAALRLTPPLRPANKRLVSRRGDVT